MIQSISLEKAHLKFQSNTNTQMQPDQLDFLKHIAIKKIILNDLTIENNNLTAKINGSIDQQCT